MSKEDQMYQAEPVEVVWVYVCGRCVLLPPGWDRPKRPASAPMSFLLSHTETPSHDPLIQVIYLQSSSGKTYFFSPKLHFMENKTNTYIYIYRYIFTHTHRDIYISKYMYVCKYSHMEYICRWDKMNEKTRQKLHLVFSCCISSSDGLYQGKCDDFILQQVYIWQLLNWVLSNLC